MDLRSYLTALRKGWWIMLIAALLGAGVGELINVQSTPIYAAHVQFYVGTPGASTSTIYSTDQYAQDRANSYAQLLSSERLAQSIIGAAHLSMKPGEVAREITGTAQLNTVLVNATVKDPSKSRALAIANAASRQFPKMVNTLDNVGGKNNVVLSVVSGPTVSSAPVSPRQSLNIALGLVVGLFLGLALAVLRHLLDNSVRTAEDLQEVSGAPVLGTIGYDAAARRAPLVVEGAGHSLRAEAFRRLRTNLQFMDAARAVNVLVVTSAVESEGKSTTATNLAIVMAESGRKVLLIEGDMRRPKVASYLGLEGGMGLSNVLAGQARLDDVLQRWGAKNVTVLVSGSMPPNPSELLGSERMVELLAELRARFDLVIIDTPPLLPVADAVVIATEADGVVVVFRYGKTKRAQVRTAVEALRSVDARVLGAVLNMKPIRRSDKRSYGSYGYYSPGPAVSNPVPQVKPLPDPDDATQPLEGFATTGARTDGQGAGQQVSSGERGSTG